MTLFALWLGMMIHRARQQHEAAEAVRKLGGEAYYDYQVKTDPMGFRSFDSQGSPPGPAWLHRVLDIDLISGITYVEFRNRALTNDDLACLEQLPHVKTLLIWWGERLDGKALEHLRNLRELEDLSLGIRLTDEDLPRLKRLQSLRWLFLMGPQSSIVRSMNPKTRVYDESIFYQTEVTAQGAEQLAKDLPNCHVSY